MRHILEFLIAHEIAKVPGSRTAYVTHRTPKLGELPFDILVIGTWSTPMDLKVATEALASGIESAALTCGFSEEDDPPNVIVLADSPDLDDPAVREIVRQRQFENRKLIYARTMPTLKEEFEQYLKAEFMLEPPFQRLQILANLSFPGKDDHSPLIEIHGGLQTVWTAGEQEYVQRMLAAVQVQLDFILTLIDPDVDPEFILIVTPHHEAKPEGKGWIELEFYPRDMVRKIADA